MIDRMADAAVRRRMLTLPVQFSDTQANVGGRCRSECRGVQSNVGLSVRELDRRCRPPMLADTGRQSVCYPSVVKDCPSDGFFAVFLRVKRALVKIVVHRRGFECVTRAKADYIVRVQPSSSKDGEALQKLS